MTERKQNARTAGVREGGSLRITWVKSAIGYNQDQKDTIKSLGLRRLNQTIDLPDTASVRGMIFKVKHLVSFEEV
ncbi:MAG: 50S ribosomal protein L30 [Chloroflexia bacterium]